MKHLKRVLGLCMLLITIIACSSDDNSNSEENQAKLIGTWKFTSSTTNGVADSTEDCELLETLVISSSQVAVTDYWGDDCSESETYSISYTLNGNSITTTEEGVSYTSEIVILNNTTFTVKDVDDGDIYINTYTRQ